MIKQEIYSGSMSFSELDSLALCKQALGPAVGLLPDAVQLEKLQAAYDATDSTFKLLRQSGASQAVEGPRGERINRTLEAVKARIDEIDHRIKNGNEKKVQKMPDQIRWLCDEKKGYCVEYPDHVRLQGITLSEVIIELIDNLSMVELSAETIYEWIKKSSGGNYSINSIRQYMKNARNNI